MKALLDLGHDPTEADMLALKAKYSNSEQTLGEFNPNVGAEVMTTRSYPVIGTGLFATATVLYSDMMMATKTNSHSMTLAIVVSPNKYDSAMEAESAAIASVSYTPDTDRAIVRTNLHIDGRLFIVGLDCEARVGTLHRLPSTSPTQPPKKKVP
jgi:hypothetical protein